MARRRIRARRRTGGFEFGPFAEAHRDALSAEMLDEIERVLAKNPKRREEIRQLTRKLLESMAEGMR